VPLPAIPAALVRIKPEFGLNLVFPCHPRTQKRLRQFGLDKRVEGIPWLKMIKAVGCLDFLLLMAKADIVLTDSGGIQEETCILRVPCVTIRDNTERPETLELGSNVIAGTDPDMILAGMRKMLSVERQWANPFGDGHAARRIVDVLMNYL
jgi:UDP-N-acetylglucosamine 2-epimerase (non-hydrolysing)